MSDITKVKINLNSGEIEIQGSETFVEKQLENLESIVETISSFGATTDYQDFPTEDIANEDIANEDIANEDIGQESSESDSDLLSVPNSFGEWFHRFPDKLQETDKVLVAGYYVQTHSKGNEFKTSQINKTLKEHGIKLSNPSRFVSYLAKTKLSFQTRRSGKLCYFRISQQGIAQLKSLLGI